MGLRGISAQQKKTKPGKKRRPSQRRHPWLADGLNRAERVVAFLEDLPVTSGPLAGSKMRLLPEQRDFVEEVYGPVGDDGLRVVRTALWSAARKNGKSGLAAGLCLCHLCGPEAEPRGQCFSAAAAQNQSGLIFDEMKAIIEQTAWLSKRCNVQRFRRMIEDLENGSIYRALAADARTVHGLNVSFAICDELAQWRSRALLDAIQTATGGRAEPLVLVISTMSEDPFHPMGELVEYARKIEEGVIDDPSFVGCIHAAPADADPWAEASWRLANPALGVFKSLADVRVQAERAQAMPSLESAFRNLHLNQSIESADHFLTMRDWMACDDVPDLERLRGKRCYGGLDLSERQDLTAFVLVFAGDDGFDVLSWFWLPRDGLLDKENADRAPYSSWLRDGHLETTPGRSIHFAHVVQRLAEICADFEVAQVAYDRWHIERMRQALNDRGLDLELENFGQGFQSMAPAVDAVEAAVLDGNLRHGGHPVLRWCASNAVIETDAAGNRKLTKSKSTGRIDGMVALAMALKLATEYRDESPRSPYDDPEFRISVL